VPFRGVDTCQLTLHQGDVYLKIIEEVIATSSTDFEESGVSQSTLQDLQRVSRISRIFWSKITAPFDSSSSLLLFRMSQHTARL